MEIGVNTSKFFAIALVIFVTGFFFGYEASRMELKSDLSEGSSRAGNYLMAPESSTIGNNPPAELSTIIYVNPPRIIIGVNTTFVIEVKVDNAENCKRAECKVEYDTFRIRCLNISGTTHFEIEETNSSGYINFWNQFDNPISGNFILASIEFKCIHSGVSALALYDTVLGDPDGNPISHAEAWGSVEIETLVLEPTLVRIEPASLICRPYQPFNITVYIENMPTDPGVAGLQFNLTWDSSVLTGVSMEEKLFHTMMPESELDNLWKIAHDIGPGYASYAYTWYSASRAIEMGYYPISGNQTLAVITLNGTATGSTTLEFSELIIGDTNANPLPYVTIEGEITITIKEEVEE